MKKYIYILLLVISTFNAHSHTDHYKGVVKIEMDIIRNNKIIGYSNYFFEHDKNKMTVKNYTKFNVDLFGVSIFSILGEATEVYEDNKLIYFQSNTYQNNKEKFVNLKFDKKSQKFIINGSSFSGEASTDCVIGNWWNHKILQANKQISPLSGSVKNQIVTFVKKEDLIINGKKYSTDHFKLKSKDDTLPDDKKLDFDIWYNKENNLILKVSYNRMGSWEYRVKNYK